MSGFSQDWLSLREPYDAAARSAALVAKLAEQLSNQDWVGFADFGCGTGANLRYTALAMPAHVRQCWRLIDHDKGLLAAAREKLRQWADTILEEADDNLHIAKGERIIEASFCHADLAATPIEGLLGDHKIATASAFFDLVSEGWIDRFVKATAAAEAIIYTTLIYNGREMQSLPHRADRCMLAAFHAHQTRDKGLGRACGPRAASTLQAKLLDAGYQVWDGASNWRLNAEDASMLKALGQFSASAAAELDVFDEAIIADWATSRTQAKALNIGHTDLLAICPSKS